MQCALVCLYYSHAFKHLLKAAAAISLWKKMACHWLCWRLSFVIIKYRRCSRTKASMPVIFGFRGKRMGDIYSQYTIHIDIIFFWYGFNNLPPLQGQVMMNGQNNPWPVYCTCVPVCMQKSVRSRSVRWLLDRSEYLFYHQYCGFAWKRKFKNDVHTSFIWFPLQPSLFSTFGRLNAVCYLHACYHRDKSPLLGGRSGPHTKGARQFSEYPRGPVEQSERLSNR